MHVSNYSMSLWGWEPHGLGTFVAAGLKAVSAPSAMHHLLKGRSAEK